MAQLEITSSNRLQVAKEEIIAATDALSKPHSEHEFGRLMAKISDMIKGKDILEKEIKVLGSFKFPAMKIRQSKVAEAHAKTSGWIFSDSSVDGQISLHLHEWLQSHGGIYWVSGCAGSGKSTLMNFLCDHERVYEALTVLAGQKVLATASFFFWNPGTDLQKSQEGLLQSLPLLHNILRQSPDMIPVTCQSRWGDPLIQSEPWTRVELMEAFARLRHEALPWTRYCFFINGLDEYGGDHTEIINVMKDMVGPNDVKVCLSSRPWNIFENAFGGDSLTMIRLQDFTREDIKRFVRGNLEDHRFKALSHMDDRYRDLVLEIVDSAQGVFLWVFLVVRSLIRGLGNEDTVALLQKRLRLLPTDLIEYFEHMSGSVDPVYKGQAAEIYQVCLAAPYNLPLMSPSSTLRRRRILASKPRCAPGLKPRFTSIANRRCRAFESAMPRPTRRF